MIGYIVNAVLASFPLFVDLYMNFTISDFLFIKYEYTLRFSVYGFSENGILAVGTIFFPL